MGERRERDPGRAVEVWAFDEHRLGLKPVLRRQWAPRGQRPVAVGHPRYEWLYLYGFVHPATGEVVWFVCSTVDAELLGAVLAAFAAAVGAREGKLIVLVLDNAGWHVSGDLVVPKGIELAGSVSARASKYRCAELKPVGTRVASKMPSTATVLGRNQPLSARAVARDLTEPRGGPAGAGRLALSYRF